MTNKNNKLEYWKNHIQCFKESGLSKAEYCRNNSIPVSSFKNWYSRFEYSQSSNIKQVKIESPDPMKDKSIPSFVELRTSEVVLSSGDKIKMTGFGLTLEMSQLPDPRWLCEVSKLLGGVYDKH